MHANRFLGKEFDGYVVEECINPGVMAEIYRAHQHSVNRDVALKIITLDPIQGEQGEFWQRFALEARLIASLEHVHILPIYDYGVVQNEFAYLAMRLVGGGTLEELLNAGPLPVERAVTLFTQAASGLAYAHSQGIIHRDLKPTNILLDDAGNGYLSDFGLAKLVELSLELTLSGAMVGTPAYMSPEQLQARPLDRRSDIYSLGVLLFEMLTGHLPFEMQGADFLSLIHQHIQVPPPHPRDFNPNIPQAVEDVILTALQKEPRARYRDVWSMIVALNQAVGRHVSTHDAPRPSIRFAARRLAFRISRRAWAPLIVALLAMVMVMGVVVSREHPPVTASPLVSIGAQGNAADAVPSNDEIQKARARLGDNGFIAYIACSLDSEFQAKRARTLADFSQQYGLGFHSYDSQMDSYRQLTLIERARSDGARGLIICPLGPQMLDHALEELRTDNIPTVLIPASSEGHGAVMVDPDNYRIGYLAGQFAGQMITRDLAGQGQVILLTYSDTDAASSRGQGMEAGLMAAAPHARIVGRYPVEPSRGGVHQLVEQLIQEHITFNVILSLTDSGAVGAIEALDEAKFAPDSVAIVSANAETLALRYIEQGHFLRGTVSVNLPTGSRIALDAMVKLLGGGNLPEIIHYEPGQVITREALQANGGQSAP